MTGPSSRDGSTLREKTQKLRHDRGAQSFCVVAGDFEYCIEAIDSITIFRAGYHGRRVFKRLGELRQLA